MQDDDLTGTLLEATRSLQGARLVCTMLRQEGVLWRSPYVVLHLADRLLRSLSLG